MRPQGVRLLGSSESVDPLSRLFRRMEPHQKLYQKKATSDGLLPSHLIVREGPRYLQSPEGGREVLDEEHAGMDLQRTIERILLTQYVPASVVCDAEMGILSVRGHTGLNLEPAQRKIDFNLPT